MKRRTLVFDLDGTLYRGTEPIDSGVRMVNEAMEQNIPVLFMTNNSMRTPQENVRHMEKMGYRHLRPEQFYNSAMAAAEYTSALDQGSRAWYIGQNGMKQALEDNGFLITEDHPDFVFVGLDKSADYARYSKVLDYLLNGARLIGTNKDRILAKPGGFEVGNGSIVALFEYAINQKSPDISKPSPVMMDLFCQHFCLKPDEILLIGDNLETDIALGINAGVRTLMVESGVHTRKDIDRLKIYPDQVISDLSEVTAEQLSAF